MTIRRTRYQNALLSFRSDLASTQVSPVELDHKPLKILKIAQLDFITLYDSKGW